ncbi:hypothetical protein DKT77_19135 [Meridianimarinicoccus roseus]|uniref:Tail sheath protein C-terminal domain-containing protein n=1 Tax=Meridianimarinicoccus roseus TaxID=2072018 RepID=A0A2V2LCS2_9RHOB|nr:phage tail sheath C-terminal domain-containing protein [Meridianimarinicoccus roseus]PWR01047.1 hypothetical protein DKT77_19135 [Meridianimarinicoccus roseus]
MFSVPGVIIQERSTIPPAVASVATAIPVFIGRTPVGPVNEATRITTMLEYEQTFGKAPIQPIVLTALKRVAQGTNALLGVDIALNAPLDPLPVEMMHYALTAFYDNGGGTCWIYSTGNTAPTQAEFIAAINAMSAVDEPTLIVCPEASRLAAGQTEAVIQQGLISGLDTKDRFMIGDVPGGYPDGSPSFGAHAGRYVNSSNIGTFRGNLSPTDPKALQYGACYWPYLRTNIPWRTNESQITLATAEQQVIPADGAAPGAPTDIAGIAADAPINHSTVRDDETAIYNAAKAFVSGLFVTLPPSPFVAGAYATIDANKGVHFAPANIGLNRVIGPAVRVSDSINADFNVDPTSGKSINVIRAFTGRGTLVWGARTLAGNDNEYRYIPVRRLMLMIEESIEKATNQFVFAPNDRTTWVRLQTMIENFLFTQWRIGALQGEKTEHAYQVLVGLGVTMTADDILNGILRVVVRVAPVRPAEFIEITFEQMLPSS